MSGDDNGFTERWSKRKTAAREESLTQEQKLASLGEQEVVDDVESPEAELLTEEDFADVDFEALDKSSDYTRFIQANVPAAIQQKALRKLWNSDSVFEVLDGMNDYDEDFTNKGLAGKVIKTAYKVGRGFLDEVDEENKEPGETRPKKLAVTEPDPEVGEVTATNLPETLPESPKDT